jgi:hypothetical protein
MRVFNTEDGLAAANMIPLTPLRSVHEERQHTRKLPRQGDPIILQPPQYSAR